MLKLFFYILKHNVPLYLTTHSHAPLYENEKFEHKSSQWRLTRPDYNILKIFSDVKEGHSSHVLTETDQAVEGKFLQGAPQFPAIKNGS